jgi:hypothetical protein
MCWTPLYVNNKNTTQYVLDSTIRKQTIFNVLIMYNVTPKGDNGIQHNIIQYKYAIKIKVQ